MVIFGEQLRNMDDKNRVILPPNIRNYLGDFFVLTIDFDGNAVLRTKQEFEKYTEVFANKSDFNTNVRTLRRIILSRSYEINVDSSNRITLQKNIVSDLAIKKEIIFIGTGSSVELWSKERWETFKSSISQDMLIDLANSVS
ncbi:cell division protein MraZ [Mycoplasma leonicaptivi]|uniref:cell division protein MraZ n=1 Tax=Mycoplasma leonicaptivi TaxID=36742 RepID=UPI00055D6C2B|nr:cell division protein MraZ [Mycoplasma leonicaptivi]